MNTYERKERSRWIGWFALISLALITTWFLYTLEEKSPVPLLDVPQVPDYTLKDFSTTSMNEEGQLKYQLIAQTMTHYPNVDTQLDAPHVTFFDQGQARWTVQAQQGQVSPDGNQIWLKGHTVIQQEPYLPQRSLKIISQDVKIQQETQYAETQAPTLILNHYGETRCVGMRVFMATKQVELLSQVRGHYVPHN